MVQQVFQIPLSNVPQKFEIELSGRPFILTVRWNTILEGWVLDLSDAKTSERLISCLPLTTGLDLFSQFKHLALGGSFVVVTDGDDLAPPTLENLGTESNLYFVTGDA